MTEKVVAYSPNRARLTRLVSEQASSGNQVMAAFLHLESAQAYGARHPYRLVGESTNGAVGRPSAQQPSWAPVPEPVSEPDPAPVFDAASTPSLTPGFSAGPVASETAVETPVPALPLPMMPVVAAPGQMEAVQPRRSGGRGQVFACYSPRGGSGTSLLAAALASRIAQDPQLRVLLVDLDLQNGSQSYFFDVT